MTTTTATEDTEETAEHEIPTDVSAPDLPEVAQLYGLTASYSPEDNKLRLRAARWMPRELYERFKVRGFTWAPKQEVIVAPMWTPDRHDFLMAMCGDISDEETSLADRAEQRADRFIGYRANRKRDGEHAYSAAHSRMAGIPMGQPILVGHHSQRRAERDAERIEGSLKKAVIMWERADYWKERVAGVIAHAQYKDRADVRARRIETIEADKRKQERVKAKAEIELKAWSSPSMTAAFALRLAGATHVIVGRDKETDIRWSAYDVLRPLSERSPHSTCPVMTWQEVQEIARRVIPYRIEYSERWINHYELRITYERALLAAQGGLHLLEKAPRPKQLPLLNYRAPEGLTVYHWRELRTLPQVEMTSAEYKRIYSDYRATRTVDNSHRVRYAMLGGIGRGERRDVCVFITDAKKHDRPVPAPKAEASADEEPMADEEQMADEAPIAEAPEPELAVSHLEPALLAAVDADSYAPKLDAVRRTLEGGVQAISRDQLFPTPAPIAERLIAALGIRSGDRVLEPEAGTGAILRAMGSTFAGAHVVAVEISRPLADQLRRLYSPLVEVICADFMDCRANGDEAGLVTVGLFDRIGMNPPFKGLQDVEHVEHALPMLAPEGILATIMLNDGQAFRPDLEDERGWGRRADRVAALRARVKAQGRTMTVEELPDDGFASQGTNVRTVLVTIE